MTSTDTQTRKCLGGCGRTLRSPKSVARGYGESCWRKVRRAERTADLSAWTASQVEEAHLAIADGAVVPSTREGVFHVVGSDGSEVHLTHRDGCNCTSGLKTCQPRPCWHRCAVAIVAPAPAAPARLLLAIAAAPAPAVDVWDALQSVGALDVVPAF